MKKYLIMIIVAVVFVGIGFILWISDKKPTIELNDDDIEVYSNSYLYDLIRSADVEIISENTMIDTSEIGSYSYSIDFDNNNRMYTKEVKVTVIDTEVPIIVTGTSKTIEVNYENDLCSLIFYADNYDRTPTCSVEGDYNLNEVGEYPIQYVVTDQSDNRSNADVSLKVIEKTDGSSYQVKAIDFDDIISIHKTENTEVGIDVSRWQGEIDFNQVKEAGATFVIIRIGVQDGQNGEVEMDYTYLQNIANAKEAGLKVGVYLYSIATSVEESIEQAHWVVDQLAGQELELPIVFDWESWSSFTNYQLNLHDLNAIADAFITTVEKEGYQAMIYGSKNYLENVWEKKGKSVWLAHYTDKTTYQSSYRFWQLTDVGVIAGINGYVDINVMYYE